MATPILNRVKKAPCERANNTCSQGSVHKCSMCQKLTCKALRHNQAQVSQFDVSDPVKALTKQVQSLASRLTSIDSAQSKTEKASASPDATHSSTSTSVPAFGLPAVSYISTQIQNILWCKMVSGDIPISPPIDSCCFVSLGTYYECNPIPVSIASPQVSTRGGVVFHPEFCFWPVTFLFLTQFSPKFGNLS